MIITERLKAARKACQLTQQQVADILGIDRSTYAYYELGTSNPSLENLVSLAAVFNTDIEWFIGSDIKKEAWHSPENELSLKLHIKERHIGDLSKDERKLVALFRLAEKNGKQKDLIDILSKAAIKDEDEKNS